MQISNIVWGFISHTRNIVPRKGLSLPQCSQKWVSLHRRLIFQLKMCMSEDTLPFNQQEYLEWNPLGLDVESLVSGLSTSQVVRGRQPHVGRDPTSGSSHWFILAHTRESQNSRLNSREPVGGIQSITFTPVQRFGIADVFTVALHTSEKFIVSKLPGHEARGYLCLPSK